MLLFENHTMKMDHIIGSTTLFLKELGFCFVIGVKERSVSSVCRVEVCDTLHGHHLVLHGFQVSSLHHV